MCNNGGCILIPLAILFGFISMLTFVFGYSQYPIYGGNYKSGIAKVTGYDIDQTTCTRTCNCHKEGFRKVCDYCKYTCYFAKINYSVNPDITFIIPSGPYDYEPSQSLYNSYPIGSELKLYYNDKSFVYGNNLNNTRNSFIAGMVFIGLSALILLCLILVTLISYIVEKKPLLCIVQTPSPSTTSTSV